MSTANSTNSPPKRSWLKRFVLAILVLIILAVVAIALLPTFISRGLFHGQIKQAISNSINGTADFAALSVSWFGEQSVSGLVIKDAAGKEAVNVNATANAGLWSLLVSKPKSVNVDLSGMVRSDLRENGTLGILDLVKPSAPGTPASPGAPSAPSSPGAAPMGAMVNISSLDVHLTNAADGRELLLKKLNGVIAYQPGSPLDVNLKGATVSGQTRGTLELTANSPNLVAADGTIAPASAGALVKLKLTNTPVLLGARDEVIESLTLDVNSDKLSEQAHLTLAGDVLLAEGKRGRLDADLTVASPISASGAISIDPRNISGRASAKQIPAGLIQPFLAATPIVLTRDFGPTLDAVAEFPGGGAQAITFVVSGTVAELRGGGRVNEDQSLTIGRISLKGDLHHQLIHDLTGLSFNLPLEAEIDAQEVSLPPITLPTAQIAAALKGRFTLRLVGPAKVTLPGQTPREFNFDELTSELITESLGRSLHLTANGTIDGAAITLDERIDGLIDEKGQWASALALNPVGELRVEALAAATIIKFVPQQAELINTALAGNPTRLSVVTQTEAGSLRGELNGSLGTHAVKAKFNELPDKVRISDLELMAMVTPALAAALQKDDPAPIVLLELASVLIHTDAEAPILISGTRRDGFDLGAQPLNLSFDSPRVLADRVPGVVGPVVFTQVAGLIGGTFSETWTAQVNVDAILARKDSTSIAAAASVSTSLASGAQPLWKSAHVVLKDVDVAQTESLLGYEAGSLSEWTGPRGKLELTLRPMGPGGYDGTATPQFERLSGKVDFEMAPTHIEVSATQPIAITLDAATLQKRLNPGTAAATGGIQVTAPMPLNVTLSKVRMPRATPDGKSIDQTPYAVDVSLTGGPLKMTQNGRPMSISGLTSTVKSANLREGVQFTLNGDATIDQQPAGKLALNGSLLNLLATDGRIDTTNAVLKLDAAATSVPTALIDMLGNMQGLVVAALGATMNATIKADDFSSRGGTLLAQLQAQHGRMDLTGRGHEGSLVIESAKPATAELALTKELRELLLYKINPILADVRTTKQPIRAIVTSASVPIDGSGVAKLNADIEITIGEVEFDSGSTTMALLKLFNQNKGATIPGMIEPIRAKIRSGVVTYDRFAVHIDKQVMVYTGQIDLNTQKVDLRTELPAEALAKTFHELEALPPGTVVPITTKGTFGKLKTEPDFSGLVKSVVPGLIQKGLEELLKKK